MFLQTFRGEADNEQAPSSDLISTAQLNIRSDVTLSARGSKLTKIKTYVVNHQQLQKDLEDISSLEAFSKC